MKMKGDFYKGLEFNNFLINKANEVTNRPVIILYSLKCFGKHTYGKYEQSEYVSGVIRKSVASLKAEDHHFSNSKIA
jgi:hypothetical protein